MLYPVEEAVEVCGQVLARFTGAETLAIAEPSGAEVPPRSRSRGQVVPQGR